jgi:hypothetical protein
MRRFSVELKEPVSLSSTECRKVVMDSVVGAQTTSAMLLKPSPVGVVLRERRRKT